jgi:signal transduction histidine kinase
MDIADLVEIALANSGASRVEVAALEPADISMEAVSGLAQLISELVDNAIAFSEPDEKVRLTGLFQQDDYLLSISDRGVGLPDDLIDELNRTLEDPAAVSGPEPKMGIALVARLARRHEIRVQLVPGVPGTTARVVLPGNLVTKLAETPGQPPVDHRLPARLPDGPRPSSRPSTRPS